VRAQKRHGRRGKVFSLRLTERQRLDFERMQAELGGPRSLGPWLVWRATSPMDGATPVLPNQAAVRSDSPVLPELTAAEPIRDRLILDLCAGSGAWSEPYVHAGYRVLRVTAPAHDVRTFQPPEESVWGVLCAPPCTEFTLARNGQDRDYRRGLEVVAACMRLVLTLGPRWWALENPVGKLSTWLGTPVDVFEPCDFGDPWHKRTALWGSFSPPKRGPYVKPLGAGPFCRFCDPKGERREWCRNPDHRAITPPGFARAFCEANP